jgi:diaminopimelate decarboxylase
VKTSVFAGVGKTEAEIKLALQNGIFAFHVESEPELARINHVAGTLGVKAPIAIRINPDVDAHTHAKITTGKSDNKFGIPLKHAAAAYEAAAKYPNIAIKGVQMHIGSQITGADPFASAIKKLVPIVSALKSKYGIKFLSIGGGMGIIYRRALESGSGQWWHDHSGESSAFSVRDYADAIVPPLRKLGVRILVEPGRFLVGNAGVLLTRVRYIKQIAQKKFAIVDAGMNDLIRPALYRSYHEIVTVNEPRAVGEADSFSASRSKSKNRTEKIDIVGPVCESGDFFALDREMPEVHEGDLLAVMSAGAYGFVMASNYNSRPLPTEALVHGDKVALIRKRQTREDLVRGEVEPEW